MIKKLKTLLVLGAITVITAGSADPVSALTTKTTTTKSKGVVYLCINGKKYKFNINSNCTNKPSVPDTNNNGTGSKPDNNTGSNNGSTSKPDNNTGSDNNSTSKPDNNTGSDNNSTSKPDNNTDSGNGSTSKPDNNTGSDNNTSKPNNNTGSDSNNSGSTNQGSTSFAAYQQEVVNLVNKERAKYGLSALKSNSSLANVATIKSQDMVNKNYFSHTSPTYGSPFDMMKQFGISYKTAGENIAMGQKTPSEVVTAWMNSEGHRKNILSSSFTQIGVGVAKNANGQLYWTQMFIG
ncbi:MAG: CAP domain-containing protein [Peptostreptococcaceae bacterium]|nr:CAP domain-containing protein [Peptostreptococcaceae bacterium]